MFVLWPYGLQNIIIAFVLFAKSFIPWDQEPLPQSTYIYVGVPYSKSIDSTKLAQSFHCFVHWFQLTIWIDNLGLYWPSWIFILQVILWRVPKYQYISFPMLPLLISWSCGYNIWCLPHFLTTFANDYFITFSVLAWHPNLYSIIYVILSFAIQILHSSISNVFPTIVYLRIYVCHIHSSHQFVQFLFAILSLHFLPPLSIYVFSSFLQSYCQVLSDI